MGAPLPPTPNQDCPACGAGIADAGVGGSCARCGARLPRPTDHRETDLGLAAAVTDRGLRHHRNEDDYAIAARDGRVVVVVCDGVSSTANPDLASTAAAQAALACLEPLLTADAPSDKAVTAALHQCFEAARVAVAGVPQAESGGPDGAPSTTMAAAWCDRGRVVTANVGDTRAYWLTVKGRDHLRLTRDHSWAEEAIQAGVPAANAYAAPGAHVITEWIGGDAEDLRPHVARLEVSGPGILLVCSDGLWNYFEPPEVLGDLVMTAGDRDAGALAVAHHLVSAAIDAGGGDNVTVAVVRLGGQPQP